MAEKNSTPEFARDIWENLAKWLHKQKKYDPKSLADPEPLAAIRETHRILSQPLQEMKIGQEIPEELTAALNNNIFYFSGFKTHHELVQASRMLKDSDGNFKPFHKFLNDIETLNKTYNKNYLRAEYNFATASTQMAVKWKEWEQDEERYNLQYRTAGDDRVREEHAALNGVTLPPSDPFWNSYLPPNGWNCRCTTVQVRKNKYPQSNSEKAMAAGAACTAKPKQQIFRFNPGKTMTVFPPKHPYYKANGEVKKTVEKITKPSPLGEMKIKNDLDLSRVIDNLNTDWFQQGFQIISLETRKHVNGSTDCFGTIWLKRDIKSKCISGFEKIRRGKECTMEEECAMATLWHEITHNRHHLSKDSMSIGELSQRNRRFMETANEFVARKTLPEFYEKIGGKMKYHEFMVNRDNCGYNKWVVKYQNAIVDYSLNEVVVLETVKKGLFMSDYHKQKQNLINGLVEGGKKINKNGNVTYSISVENATDIVEKLIPSE